MAATYPSYRLRIDWDNDGAFSQTNDDVSADVRYDLPLSVERGRDQAREFSPPIAGAVSFSLDNPTGKYSYANASGALYGKLLPGRSVDLAALWSVGYAQTVKNDSPSGYWRLGETQAARGYARTVLNDSPSAYWRLNEAAGTAMADSSGNGRTLTLAGAAATLSQTGALAAEPSGSSDTAVLFNASGTGAGDAGSYGTATTPAFGTTWTLEAWFKKPASFRAGGDELFTVVTAAGQLEVLGVSTHVLRVFDGGAGRITGTAVVDDGAWHHVAVVCDGSTTKMYIDGVQDGSTYAGTINITGTTLNVGRSTGGGFTFNGLIDEAACYATAVSLTRLQAHRNAGLNQSNSDAWPITTSAADASGNGNAGTYAANVQGGQAGAIAAELDGTSNTAALFDGSSGYVAIPAAASLRPTAAITVELWASLVSSGAFQYLIDHKADSAAQGIALQVNTAGTQIYFTAGGTVGGVDVLASGVSLFGGWHHIVATYDGANVRLYIDGVLAKTQAATGSIAWDAAFGLSIGRNNTGGNFTAGTLDEVAVYPAALSAARVLAHYNAGRDQGSPSADTTAYQLARAYLRLPTESPYRTDQEVRWDAYDGLSRLVAAENLSTAMYTSIRTDQAIGYVLDAIGWPVGARVLDTGATTLARWWVDGVTAFDAIRDLVFTEGPGALFYVDTSGNFVFESRHYRLLTARSITAQATFRGTGAEPVFGADFNYEPGLRGLINACTVPVRSYVSAAGVTLDISATVPLTLAPNEARKFSVSTQADGFSGATDHVTCSAGSAVASFDRTSGKRCTVTLTAGASGATVSAFSVTATTWTITEQDVSNTIDASASIGVYGPRMLPDEFVPQWIPTVSEATDFCNAVVGRYSAPRPQVRFTLSNADPARLYQAFTRQISDRIRVVESVRSFVDADFTIETMRHDVSDGRNSKTQVSAEACSTQTYWALGVGGFGELGSATYLGY